MFRDSHHYRLWKHNTHSFLRMKQEEQEGLSVLSSAYNDRRKSCENVVAAIQKKHPHVEFLRDANMSMLDEVKEEAKRKIIGKAALSTSPGKAM